MLILSAFNLLKPQLRLVQRQLSRVDGSHYANRVFALEAYRATTKAFFATAAAKSNPSTDASPIVVVAKDTQSSDAAVPQESVKSDPKEKKKKKKTKKEQKTTTKTKKSKSSKRQSKDEQSVKIDGSIQSSDQQEQYADDERSADGLNKVADQKPATKPSSKKQRKKVAPTERQAQRSRVRIRRTSSIVSTTVETKDQLSRIYHLQDPRSRVFNFDPYLQMIMPVAEFDFNALTRFVASSQDERLARIAKKQCSKYVGSTSSMTGILSHFHFLLSQWRELNLSMLSKGFSEKSTSFTKLTRGPCAIMLRWRDGTYAIDADKEFDSPTILAMLGKSMEKLMVLPTEAYERYRKSDPQGVSEEEREATESYHYSTMGDFLMRSQLDAHDSRLPGTGMFDIKTRAVVSIRMSASDHEKGMGYEIRHGQGRWESFEREYYDMMRATLLKYSLQVRIGRMDGIFAAFHNVERIFGFQYISLPEIDRALHGQDDTILGDQEFKISLALLNKVLNRATQKFPNTSLRFHFETRDASVNFMYIFVEPVTEAEVDSIQQATKKRIEEYERSVLGLKPQVENDEKENSKDWESIMDQVKDEMHNDAIDSGEQSTTDIDAGNPCSSSEDDQGHRNQRETSQEQAEGQASDETILAFDDAQTEATAGISEGEASSETPQSTVDASDSTENKSILAMTLMTRSRINGKYQVRPEDLKPHDDWKVEHSITEIASQSRARSLYEACKRRRKILLPQYNPEDEVEDVYRHMIRQISDKGREWRNKMDEWESQRQRVVFQAGDTSTVNPIRPTEQAS
ncbi:MAG: hypothetical protein Q9165_005420 [Trypethelium subeluteriae]